MNEKIALSVDREMTPERRNIKRLYMRLKIAPEEIGFECHHKKDCLSPRGGTRFFQTGDWPYVGSEYGKAKVLGKKTRILFISMDRGGKHRTNPEFEKTQKDFRVNCIERGNSHMGVVSLVMEELVDNKSSENYAMQFALINSVKCRLISKSDQSTSTQTMRKRCLNNIKQEIDELIPDLIIVQSLRPSEMIKTLFELNKPVYVGHDAAHPTKRILIYETKNRIIVTNFPHSRVKGLKYKKDEMPLFVAKSIEKIKELLQRSK
jgi:signal recognition particle subunit SEC65